MKTVKTFIEFLNESNGLIDNYFDYYIANKDTQVKNERGRNINIGNGTVIHAIGGGLWQSIDGKITVGINVLKDNSDFDVVNNSIWPDTIDLIKEIEVWSKNTGEVIQKDPKNIQKIIDDRSKIIDAIRKMIK
jgi:hypothetical protein